MIAIRAKISDSGRLSLPAAFRRAIGIERGGDVVVELDGREIRVRTVNEAIDNAQALTRKLLGNRRGSSVDAFLTDKRRAAKRE